MINKLLSDTNNSSNLPNKLKQTNLYSGVKTIVRGIRDLAQIELIPSKYRQEVKGSDAYIIGLNGIRGTMKALTGCALMYLGIKSHPSVTLLGLGYINADILYMVFQVAKPHAKYSLKKPPASMLLEDLSKLF